MLPITKFEAVQRLAALAGDYPDIENDILALVRKIVGASPMVHNIPTTMEPTVSEMVLARCSGKVDAIKAHRNRTGIGLKESKDAIEQAGYKLGFMDREGKLLTAFQKAS